MIQQIPDIVLEVTDDADVCVEGVLVVLVLQVADTVVLHSLQLGLAPPAKEVMNTTMVIIPVV